ncbi:MAG: hypothetical protein DRO11_06885 [Methanobacteriota archaeon]|nr:MAG: hypothetical protein DRO11_06885 [Euryarchaeota archaeon]
MFSLILPKRIKERLEEEARRLGVSEDEIVLEALSKQFDEALDPESRVDLHLALSEKYMGEAEEMLEKKDYTQASEEAWGAASQIVKAVASERGLEIRSHGELHKFVAMLREEKDDPEISTLWSSAISLHQNFYENWLPPKTVKDLIGNVKSLVDKLRKHNQKLGDDSKA